MYCGPFNNQRPFPRFKVLGSTRLVYQTAWDYWSCPDVPRRHILFAKLLTQLTLTGNHAVYSISQFFKIIFLYCAALC
jgi:hypothetical protein